MFLGQIFFVVLEEVALNEHVPNMWQYLFYFNCTLLAVMFVVWVVFCYKMFHPVEMLGYAKEMTPEEAYECLETGDLVFTSSTSIGALCIKYFTVVNWVYIGMIVKDLL